MNRKRKSVDYNSQNLTESDRLWKTWLVGKDHLHPDTIEEILAQWKEGRCSLVVEEIPALGVSPAHQVLVGVSLELEVEFAAEAAEPKTWNYPGSSASLQVLSAKLGETIFPQRVFDELMSEYSNEIEEACWDRLSEKEEEWKKLAELKDKETRLKEQIELIEEVVSELKQKLFAMDEISWDLKRNLSMLQREIIEGFKKLSKDEVLAVRSGLSLEEIQRGKEIWAKTLPAKTKDA